MFETVERPSPDRDSQSFPACSRFQQTDSVPSSEDTSPALPAHSCSSQWRGKVSSLPSSPDCSVMEADYSSCLWQEERGVREREPDSHCWIVEESQRSEGMLVVERLCLWGEEILAEEVAPLLGEGHCWPQDELVPLFSSIFSSFVSCPEFCHCFSLPPSPRDCVSKMRWGVGYSGRRVLEEKWGGVE